MLELVAESCLPNCKLDVYMDSFRGARRKYPVMYLRLYQLRPSVENLLVSGLPLVLDDLLNEVHRLPSWGRNRKGVPPLALVPMTEIHWPTTRTDRMLGLTRDELRFARKAGFGAFFWRLFVRSKAAGERLTAEDIQNAFCLETRTSWTCPARLRWGRACGICSGRLSGRDISRTRTSFRRKARTWPCFWTTGG